jgi:hypothetical protein
MVRAAAPLAQGTVQDLRSPRVSQVGYQFEKMSVRIGEEYRSCWHPAMNDRLRHRTLDPGPRRMDRFNPALNEVRGRDSAQSSHSGGDIEARRRLSAVIGEDSEGFGRTSADEPKNVPAVAPANRRRQVAPAVSPANFDGV